MTYLVMPQGVTWSVGWTLTGSPGPLTPPGWSARAQVRSDPDSLTVLWEWSTTPAAGQGTASIAAGATAGTIVVTLAVTPAQSAAWTWRSGYYDVEAVDPAGQVVRVDRGRIAHDREITR